MLERTTDPMARSGNDNQNMNHRKQNKVTCAITFEFAIGFIRHSFVKLFASFTQGLLVLNETALDQVLFWLAGSVANRPLDLLVSALPYMAIALTATFLRAKELNVLSIGDDVAVGLGQRTIWIKFFFGTCAVILAGCAVAVAGPIGFVGIIIPHLIRSLVGLDHRWILPYSAIGGAALLLLADIGGRYVLMPQELPVGVMTALIGVPFFIFVARRKLGI